MEPIIKCRTIEKFTLEEFDKLKNICRKNNEERGKLFVGDTFECDEKMAKYLLGENAKQKIVAKVIEIKR